MNLGFCFVIELKEIKVLIEIFVCVVKYMIVCVFCVINYLLFGRIKD